MKVRVRHSIDRLADKYEAIPAEFDAKAPRIVWDNVALGRDLTKALARQKAGPHGENYFKRIKGEMTGQLEGEYGPTGEPKTDFVGVGFRHGVNTDLPQSADKAGPSLAADVQRLVGELFR